MVLLLSFDDQRQLVLFGFSLLVDALKLGNLLEVLDLLVGEFLVKSVVLLLSFELGEHDVVVVAIVVIVAKLGSLLRFADRVPSKHNLNARAHRGDIVGADTRQETRIIFVVSVRDAVTVLKLLEILLVKQAFTQLKKCFIVDLLTLSPRKTSLTWLLGM